jgi:hypothetical protein|tara:strand:+ start:264 stop:2126 length:1863 start_codon:yes stop_codon:yes gene_type:complete
MKFGIESYSLAPPFSAIISIILILGFYKIGKLIFKINLLRDTVGNVSNLSYQYIAISLLTISVTFYPLILFVKLNNNVFTITSYIVILFGCLHIVEKIFFLQKNVKFKKKYFFDYNKLLLIIFLISFFLLSLAPITDADSLDYHISVPIYVINYGLFPKDISWFHAAQSGIAEIPIIFGLVVGAEQFGSLCQFSGLISIVGILIKNISELTKKNFYNKKYYLIFLFLSIPVLIFLSSTAKPQLILISFSILAFVITIYDFDCSKKANIFFKFFFITLLLYVSFEGKFSFILSSFIIWIIASYKILKKGNYNIFLIVCLILLIISFPSFYWKYINYDGNFVNKIYFPFFNIIEGYDQFYESLNQCEFPCSKTFFLIPNSVGRYTESLGIAIFSILFLFFVKEKNKVLIIISVIFYLIILSFFGKFSPRFFIEPVLWSIIVIKYSKIAFSNIFFRLIKYLILLQSSVSLAAILFGIITISIGSLTPNLKNLVLNNSAYGYDLAKWVNQNLEKDKKVLYTHRSISFLHSETISTDFLHYTEAGEARRKYLNLMKKKNPDYLVLQSDSPLSHQKLIACTSGIFKKKENFFKQTSRNIFNKNNNYYSGYIYNFDYKKLPNCYLNQ